MADHIFFDVEIEPESAHGRVKHDKRRRRDFGTDPIARQDQKPHEAPASEQRFTEVLKEGGQVKNIDGFLFELSFMVL